MLRPSPADFRFWPHATFDNEQSPPLCLKARNCFLMKNNDSSFIVIRNTFSCFTHISKTMCFKHKSWLSQDEHHMQSFNPKRWNPRNLEIGLVFIMQHAAHWFSFQFGFNLWPRIVFPEIYSKTAECNYEELFIQMLLVSQCAQNNKSYL